MLSLSTSEPSEFKCIASYAIAASFRSKSGQVLLLAVLFLFFSVPALAQSSSETSAEAEGEIESVTLFPVFDQLFISSEHPAGAEDALGDRLGRDFVVMNVRDSGIPSAFENDGTQNEDWYGWRENVLAPFDGTVKEVVINEDTNKPGRPGKPPASSIMFERDDGLSVVYAHVREVMVEEGDAVEAGEAVAQVGNNGVSFMPHIHVGAWKDGRPLQIQVDLEALGELMNHRYLPAR